VVPIDLVVELFGIESAGRASDVDADGKHDNGFTTGIRVSRPAAFPGRTTYGGL